MSQHIAQSLLLQAHPPDQATSIFTDKVLHKPLCLRATSPNPTSHDARTQRRLRRLHKTSKAKAQSNGKTTTNSVFLSTSISTNAPVNASVTASSERKPKPLSAKQKRASGIYDIPRDARRYELYVGLHRLWVGYMREILGLRGVDGPGGGGGGGGDGGGAGPWRTGTATERTGEYVTAQSAGRLLASADYHGAELTVVRSRCVGMVGLRGIVVRDTKFTFQVITRKNELKVIPKKHTVFRFEIELERASAAAAATVTSQEEQPQVQEQPHDGGGSGGAGNGYNGGGDGEDGVMPQPRSLIFEIYGSQFENRAADRATKKFKGKHLVDL